jgi:hypothetical protein
MSRINVQRRQWDEKVPLPGAAWTEMQDWSMDANALFHMNLKLIKC